eukprot:TRINITY_DN481_c0_g6_i1.p1 TRINITY_DN481_c0_g6~~TRINITY_DN481_c0_g6_i1.p1  ORF type:complete len:795 (-),score=156.45 TRINITY_DN481_c0_g6_i1:490-2802(-)
MDLDDNLLDNEETACALIKDLISSRGLERERETTSRRLKLLEVDVQRVSKSLEECPEQFCPKGGYDRITQENSNKLAFHDERLASLDDLVQKLTGVVQKDVRDEMTKMRKSVGSMHGEVDRIQNTAAIIRSEAASHKDELMVLVNQLQARFDMYTAGGIASIPQVEELMKEQRERFDAEIKKLEDRSQQFAKEADERIMRSLVSSEPQDSVQAGESSSKGGANSFQATLLNLIQKKHVVPLKRELNSASQRMNVIHADMAKQKEELVQKIRVAEKIGWENKKSLQVHSHEMHHEVISCAKKADVETLENRLYSLVAGISDSRSAFESTTLNKLNQFADHFTSIQEVIEDHEHCIRHHAEDLEDRSTKYDLLVCRAHVDRCVPQEDFDRELFELKKVITLNSSRLEMMSAAERSGSKRRPKKGRFNGRSRGNSVMSSAASPFVRSMTNMSFRSNATDESGEHSAGAMTPMAPLEETEAARGDVEPELASAPQTGEFERETTWKTDASEDDFPQHIVSHELPAAAVAPAAAPAATAAPTPEAPAAASVAAAAQQLAMQEDHSDDESEDDFEAEPVEESTLSGSRTLGEQLEVVVMCLFATAFLSLRDAKTGESRQRIQQQERTLLEELSAVRQWIVEKCPPAGWTPHRLTTLVLAFSELPRGRGSAPDFPRRKKKESKSRVDGHETPSDGEQRSSTLRRGTAAALGRQPRRELFEASPGERRSVHPSPPTTRATLAGRAPHNSRMLVSSNLEPESGLSLRVGAGGLAESGMA